MTRVYPLVTTKVEESGEYVIFGTGELKYPALFGLKRDEIGTAYAGTETKREKAKFGVLD